MVEEKKTEEKKLEEPEKVEDKKVEEAKKPEAPKTEPPKPSAPKPTLSRPIDKKPAATAKTPVRKDDPKRGSLPQPGSVASLLMKLNAKAAEEDMTISQAIYPTAEPLVDHGDAKKEEEPIMEEPEVEEPPAEMKLEPIAVSSSNPNNLMEQMARQAEQVRLMIEQSKKSTPTRPSRVVESPQVSLPLYSSIC